MKRRSFLQFGQQTQTRNVATANTTLTTTDLEPYTGQWSTVEAAFLLRRTTFGPKPTHIKQAVADGLSATIGQLFANQPLPDPPVYYDYEDDPNAGLGETWVNTPIPTPSPQGIFGGRYRSLIGSQLGLLINGGVSIREKMVLFWHNHFALDDNNAQFGYQYLDVLRRNALGNFRTMVEEITVAPAMLRYLNGHQNSRQAPNENYARELLELFTIGRGEVAAPGDYTNYTEDDVVQMARALTGWRFTTPDNGLPLGVFVANRHDTGEKQLSHRFDNAIISDAGDQEYKVVIDHILQKTEVARFLSRQLHIWFVGTDIDGVVEANIIEPMAQLIIDNNYDIQPAVEALLGSNYFFEETHRGCMTSHPLDFMFKIVNTLDMGAEAAPLQHYFFWNQLRRLAESLEMKYMALPSVAGWKAFYQSPQFYNIWINSVSLPIRQTVGNTLLNGINSGGVQWRVNLLDFIAEMDNNLDPNSMLEQIALYLFAYPISDNQRDFLKEVLIPGLPDFEWTVEYADFLQNPDDPDLRDAIFTKLESLFGTLFKMPEFHLI